MTKAIQTKEELMDLVETEMNDIAQTAENVLHAMEEWTVNQMASSIEDIYERAKRCYEALWAYEGDMNE